MAFSGYNQLCDANLPRLERDGLVMGVWPAAGGRIVYFGTQSENALHACPDRWGQPVPEPSPEAEWDGLLGHETWAGPQRDFWNQQTLVAPRFGERDPWPPDPYLLFGRCEVVAQSDSSVELRGPESPVTGLQLHYRYSLRAGGAELTIRAVNCRAEPVAWGLWSNTRIRPDAMVLAPAPSEGFVKLEASPTPAWNAQPGPVRFFPGWVGLAPPAASPPAEYPVAGKLSLSPRVPIIAAFWDRRQFVKRRLGRLERPVHDLQAPVELFIHHGEPLSELEMHGAYEILPPGGSTTWSEEWLLNELKEPVSSLDEAVALLDSFLLNEPQTP